jgi:hypothetical protein
MISSRSLATRGSRTNARKNFLAAGLMREIRVKAPAAGDSGVVVLGFCAGLGRSRSLAGEHPGRRVGSGGPHAERQGQLIPAHQRGLQLRVMRPRRADTEGASRLVSIRSHLCAL